jgi:hypothetical protein
MKVESFNPYFPRNGEPLHMGLGIQSMAQCYELHQRLDEAFSKLSALQQGYGIDGTMGIQSSDEEYSEAIEMRSEIEFIAVSIYTALTGVKTPRIK